MKNNKKQFVFNAGSGFISQAVFAGVGFIVTPFTLTRLGIEAYGVFQLATSALVFFGYLQFGMGPTMVRCCSQAIAKKDYDEIRKITSTAQLILASLGLIGLCLCIAFMPVFLKFYNIPPEMTYETSGLLTCMAFSFFLNMVVIVPSGIVLGSNRYDLANGIEVAANLLRLVLIVATFELIRPSLFTLGICMLASQVFRFAVYFVFAIKNVGRSILFSFRAVSREKFASLLSFSALNLVHSIANFGVIQGPVLIIGKTLGTAVVSSLAPAILISSSMQSFLGQMSRPLVPMASRAQAENQYETLGRWAIALASILSVIGLAMLLPMCVFGQEIIGFWLGAKMSHIWLIVAIMAFSAVTSQPGGILYFFALGGGDIRPSVYSQIMVGIVTSCSVAIGTYWLGFQLIDVVLLTTIVCTIRSSFYLTFRYSKDFSYSVPRYFREVYGKPLLLFILVAGIGYSVKFLTHEQTLPMVIMETTGLLCLYGIAAWSFLLPVDIKAQAKKTIFTRWDITVKQNS